MLVDVVPRCSNLVLDNNAKVKCCMRVSWFGITLANGVVHHACIDCSAKRLAILGDKLDTAKIVFYVKKKND